MTAGEWQSYHERYPGPGHTVVGDLRVYPDLYSPQLQNKRDLVVCLPPAYHDSRRAYPVLYMMDGQNLFDEATAHALEWQADETMLRLAAEGIEAILVAVANGGDRRTDEYSPFSIPGEGGGGAHLMAQFMVETVLPLVEGQFRVQPERESRFLFGSSLGALFALYLLHERPDLFGGAGLMSPSLWPANYAIFAYLSRRPATGARIYLDVGTRELSGRFAFLRLHCPSRQYRRAAERLYGLLAGREAAAQLRFVVAAGARHGEPAWARRLPEALRFLLANPTG